MQAHWKPWIAPLAAAFVTVACSEGDTGRVSLAVATSRPAEPGLVAWAGQPAMSVVTESRGTQVANGGDTLFISSAEVVLREIELERVEAADCPNTSNNDACEEFEMGPRIVGLPVDGNTNVVLTVNAPAAAYDELEFKFDDPSNSKDAGFIAQHPDFRDASIIVRGTFSRNGVRKDFVFRSNMEEEYEIEVIPFLQVVAGEPVNVTLRLDVSRWFMDRFGRLVDPMTANDDGPNEHMVEDNIEDSIEVFRDDNRDGLADDAPA